MPETKHRRPCFCDRPACGACWRWYFRPKSRKAWGGPEDQPTVPAGWAADQPDPHLSPERPAGTSAPAKVRLDCVHLGGVTGETRLCPECAGKVEVKLFACGKHGVCTPAKTVGVACCATCPDYEPRG